MSTDREDDELPPSGAARLLTQDSHDSLLRAAAEIPEPSPSLADLFASGLRTDLHPGTVIAKRYRLDRELGRGGMGVVWEATHLLTRRQVAIKFVGGSGRPRTDVRRRFLREARVASAVNHPNVVEVLDVFELDDQIPVMVMERLFGETLRDRLAREQKLSLEATAGILMPVVSAVAAAHAGDIVHRDLKPENIFLLRGCPRGVCVKVLDFGIAKLTGLDEASPESDPITGTGSTLGTPSYMAPEQALGERDIDGRADVWALGVVAYECISGVRPVQGSGIGQVVKQLLTEGIKPIDSVVPDLPPEVAALVMRMLARDRAARLSDLGEVERALAAYALPVAGEVGASRSSHPSGGDLGRPTARVPVSDTPGPQSVTNGKRRPASRPMLVAVATALGLASFVAWRATLTVPTKPAVEEPAKAASAFVAPAPAVPAASAETVSATTAAIVAPAALPEGGVLAEAPQRPRAEHSTAPRIVEPTVAPAGVPGASRPTPTRAAPDADSAPRKAVPSVPAPPAGLAEKPPF
jgi:serine/threonine-protein kinase